jgi:type IV pilus assembly protein PilA
MVRASPASTRGFTLVELLVVVAMVGILATLAIVGYRKYIASAGTSEALAMIQQIRLSETERKSEMLRYQGCSGCGAAGCSPGTGSLTAYYPMSTPSSKKYTWTQSGHPDFDCWRLLNVRTDGAVRFGYAVVAGDAGDSVIQPSGFGNLNALQQPNEPWYVIQAAGDRDEDSKLALLAATSWSNEVYVEDDTE